MNLDEKMAELKRLGGEIRQREDRDTRLDGAAATYQLCLALTAFMRLGVPLAGIQELAAVTWAEIEEGLARMAAAEKATP